MTIDTKLQYSRMAGRLIDHVANGTTDWATDTMEVPSTEYTDAEQWQQEMDSIFKRQPILVGVSAGERRDDNRHKASIQSYGGASDRSCC
jgi:hypothetical protein